MADLLTAADESAALEDLHTRGFTDGLPVIIPTPARASRMVLASGLEADMVLGTMGPGASPDLTPGKYNLMYFKPKETTALGYADEGNNTIERASLYTKSLGGGWRPLQGNKESASCVGSPPAVGIAIVLGSFSPVRSSAFWW